MPLSGGRTRTTKRIRLAVLISGGGTTLRNLIAKIAAGELPAEIVKVISSTDQAGGLDHARNFGLPWEVVDWKGLSVGEASRRVFESCRASRVQLVVLAGFLKMIVIPPDFEHRVVNIHPALIPAFCGKGFYGRKVHEAVLAYGAKLSGCTVHFADNEYDHGPIILQEVVPVLDDDTPETLAGRVFQAECRAYPEAIRWIAENRVRVEGTRVRVLPPPSADLEEV
ncbi:MAG: phosphoribosylglycinamide formyltransferase [Thermogutta sp.]